MKRDDLIIQNVIDENDFLRISYGKILASDEDITLITFLKPNTLTHATRHAIRNQLYTRLATIDSGSTCDLVLSRRIGIPLKEYVKGHPHTKDERVYLGYELLKVVRKYSDFPASIQYQFIQLSQWYVINDVLTINEAIKFDESVVFTLNDIFHQLAYLLDLIIMPTQDAHIQFIENLLRSNHDYKTLDKLIEDYKAIFIYEKPDAIASIPREYHLIFSDKDAPKVPISSTTTFVASKIDVTPAEEVLQDTYLDTVNVAETNDLMDDLEVTPESLDESFDDTINIDSSEDLDEEINEVFNELFGDVSDKAFEKEDLPDFCDLSPEEDPFTLEDSFTLDDSDESLDEITQEVLLLDEVDVLDEPDDSAYKAPAETIFVNKAIVEKQIKDITLQDDLDENPPSVLKNTQKIWMTYIFPIAATLLIVFLTVIGVKSLFFKPNVLEASYKIETLSDERVAFINTSKCTGGIESSEWSVYYDDKFIQQFVTDNLYPIFNTAGEYTISLRVKTSKGDWSDVYSEVYYYEPAFSTENASNQ